jgi:hypothetical protein
MAEILRHQGLSVRSLGSELWVMLVLQEAFRLFGGPSVFHLFVSSSLRG